MEARGTAKLLEGATTVSPFEAYGEHILFPMCKTLFQAYVFAPFWHLCYSILIPLPGGYGDE